jgi:hypothetical protein
MRFSPVLAIVKKLTGGKAWNKPDGVRVPSAAKKNRAADRAVDAANRAALKDAAARQPASTKK